MAIDKQIQPIERPIPMDDFSGPMEIELELLPEDGEMPFEEEGMEMDAQATFDENLVDFLEQDVLGSLGSELTSLYSEDKESRQDWYESF